MTARSDAPTRKPHPVTRSEFARRACRKPSSITEACAGPLLAACMPGGRINAVHPAAVAWAAKRGIDPAALLDTLTVPPDQSEASGDAEQSATPFRTSMRGKGRPKAGSGPAMSSATEYTRPANVVDLLGCTLHELTTRHGSAQGFVDWLDTRKQIAETARLESRNDRDAGRLISAEFVKLHVFGLLDEQNRRLLNNAPQTISVRALATARNGGTLEDLRALIGSAISTELRVSKERIRRAIRACKTGDNPPEVSPSAKESRVDEDLRSFARDLTAKLCTDFVPQALEFLLKEIARAACGEKWNQTVFAEVMATKTELAPDVTRIMSSMIAAHVADAVTESIQQEHRADEPT